MNELFPIKYSDADEPKVFARELHKALGIEKRFSAWFDVNSQGFVLGEDFTSVLSGTVVNNGAYRELEDYDLPVDMAKHICLMSRTDKGKQCRQYLRVTPPALGTVVTQYLLGTVVLQNHIIKIPALLHGDQNLKQVV